MHKNRIELSRGRVTSIKTINCGGESLETFASGAEPLLYFVDAVVNNERCNLWDGDDYRQAKEVAEEAASETGYAVANRAGCHVV